MAIPHCRLFRSLRLLSRTRIHNAPPPASVALASRTPSLASLDPRRHSSSIALPSDPISISTSSSSISSTTITPSQQLPPDPLSLLQHLHGSPHHHDLPTFLAYCARTSLPATSTVAVGTRYEYVVLSALQHLGFHLVRTGRTADRGIDLLGIWRVPGPGGGTRHEKHNEGAADGGRAEERVLRVLLQCKAHARPVSPDAVRSLEGAFAGAPARWSSLTSAFPSASSSSSSSSSDVSISTSAPPQTGLGLGPGTTAAIPTLGLLVTPLPATKGVRAALSRSRHPVGFLQIGRGARESGGGGSRIAAVAGGGEEEEGVIRQFVWNGVAEEKGGLVGLGVTLRYDDGDAGKKGSGRVALTWEGRTVC